MEDLDIYPVFPVTAFPNFREDIAQEDNVFLPGFDEQDSHKKDQRLVVR